MNDLKICNGRLTISLIDNDPVILDYANQDAWKLSADDMLNLKMWINDCIDELWVKRDI